MDHLFEEDIFELVALPPAEPGNMSRLPELAFRADAWLPSEEATLRRLFEADESIEDIALVLRRPLSGVRTRISDLGMRRRSTRPWTEFDDQHLMRRYGEDPTSVIALEIGRTTSAIYARAAMLGLTEGKPPPYTAWEDAQISAGYTQGLPLSVIAAIVGRPLSGLVSRAGTLGLRHPSHPPDWTNAETTLILALAEQGMAYRDMPAELEKAGYSARTKVAVGQRLRILGYERGWGRRWEPEEDALLRQCYEQGGSLTPLRTRLARTPHSIRWRAEYLGLRGTHPRRDGFREGPVWTEADLATLRAEYGKTPTAELARKLGRRKAAIYTRANVLGLEHGWCRDFTAEDDAAIKTAWFNGTPLRDLAEALQRQEAVVAKRAIKIGYRLSDPLRPVKAPRTRRAGREPKDQSNHQVDGAVASTSAPQPFADHIRGMESDAQRPATAIETEGTPARAHDRLQSIRAARFSREAQRRHAGHGRRERRD